MRRAVLPALVAMVLVAAACGGDDAEEPAVAIQPTTSAAAVPETPPPEVPSSPTTTAVVAPGDGCADVVEVTIEPTGDTFSFSATVRSADTGWEKYADAWVVQDAAGNVFGERVLAHPHVGEQPFTRSLAGVSIPPELIEVEVAARDSVAGYCGATVLVGIPGRS